MAKYHYDFETTSRCDLMKLGGYRYACDPSTRILMFAIAKDDGDPVLWRFDQAESPESREAAEMLQEATDSGDPVYAFNAPFEVAVARYRLEEDVGVTPPDINQYRCVQAMCRRAAIPVSLAKAQEFLRLPTEKDKRGKSLIDIFSKQETTTTLTAPEGEKIYDRSEKGRRAPNRKTRSPILGWDEATKEEFDEGIEVHHDEILWHWLVKVDGEEMTVREAWNLFCEYCRKDVIVERQMEERLHKFDLTGDALKSFLFNLRMNDRGVPVNIEALKTAQKIIDKFRDRVLTRFRNLTGFVSGRSPKFKTWLQECGYPFDDLQAPTVEECLADYQDFLTDDALAALKMHQLLNFNALDKVTAMLNASCPDGYVRGTMTWHGARTGRATGKIIQPQNMKKATMETKLAYQMICEGCSLADIEEMWESPLEVIASCARHFVQPHEGKALDADFVGVEARIGPWVCGQEDKLESILRGEDQYKVMASRIAFKCPYDEVNKAQRQVGKVLELQCIYGTGGRAMRDSLADMGVRKTTKECNAYVREFRSTFSKYPDAWKKLEDAFKKAIETGKTTKVLQDRVRVGRVKTAGLKYVVIELPSRRRLYYPSPNIKPTFKKYTKEEMLEDPWKAEKGGYYLDQIRFWGTIPGTNGSKWGWVPTWGSRLFENVVQAIGADMLEEGCMNAEANGYDIFMIVHDQALAYGEGEENLDRFKEVFCGVGSWADGFPLEADGDVVPYYMKEID